ncbi:MAG: MGMT family protein [Rikenellaceae bacterium]|nr:MGMT family protein [Rikenellaceae bacterium]
MTEEEKKLFIDAVLELIELIPCGRVTSYKKLARAAGRPNNSRMVGRIISVSGKMRDGIPAHRVVASSGILSGKRAFGSGNEMAGLLAGEGVEIRNNKVCNVHKIMWDPIEELL